MGSETKSNPNSVITRFFYENGSQLKIKKIIVQRKCDSGFPGRKLFKICCQRWNEPHFNSFAYF